MHEIIHTTAMRSQSRATALGAALLAILSTVSNDALADSTGITCTGSAETIPITMPSSITVPRDAVVGQVISDWVPSAPNQNFYQCQASADAASATDSPDSGVAFRPVSLNSSGMSVIHSQGRSYGVWDTNLPGVGVAIGVRAYSAGETCSWNIWVDLQNHWAVLPYPWTGGACNRVLPPINLGGQVEMALVKTGPIQPGLMTGGIMLEASAITGSRLNGSYSIAPTERKKFLVSSTAVNVAACSTANVAVDLGSHKQSRFTGVGSTTPAVSFNLSLSSCPRDLNAIRYQFIPLTTVLDSSNGVLALSADSTATGIGVQVKDSNGSPLKFNTPYTLASYNKDRGGTYSIPLTASYYQTSSPVKPGTANSLLTFTMSYQ